MMLTHFDKSIITFINTDTLQHVLTTFLSGQRPKLFQQNQLIITRFGCFSVCISDQDQSIITMLSMINFEMAGIEHRVSSAYHPQTNGLDERMNQKVTKAIVKYLNPEQDDWDEHIDAILFSYRTSIHASTNFTPFYLMCGREAVLPVELQMTDQTVEKLHVDSDIVQSLLHM